MTAVNGVAAFVKKSLVVVSATLFTTAVVGKDASSTIAFLRFGKPYMEIASTTPRGQMKQYVRAVEKFSEDPCFELREPELLRIEWEAISTLQDLEVCLFTIADRLRDQHALLRALRENGLGGPRLIESPPEVARFFGIEGKKFFLSFGVPRKFYPNGLGAFWARRFAHSLSVGISLDKSGKPFDVRAAYTFE